MTRVLIQVVGAGFYRAHSGLIIFLFVAFISYCFFINILNHVPPGELVYYNLILMLSFVSTPLMTSLVFLGWLLYTLKVMSFVEAQLKTSKLQFIFYNMMAYSKRSQLRSWFIVHGFMLMPILIYAIYAISVGLIFHYTIIPVIIFVFTVMLIFISAIFSVRMIHRYITIGYTSRLLSLTRKWPKPSWAHPLYWVLHEGKLSWFITKGLSFSLIAGLSLIKLDEFDRRIAALVGVGIAMCHSVLVYQVFRKEESCFSISRNVPVHRLLIYARLFSSSMLFLLPEVSVMLFLFPFFWSVQLILFISALLLFFRCLLYRVGLDMNVYLPWMLGVFVTLYLLIMFKVHLLLLIALILSLSYFLFNRYYYKQDFFKRAL
jgi:hypothetical protein